MASRQARGRVTQSCVQGSASATTSPAFFVDVHDAMAAYEGIYGYFENKMVLFNTDSERFEAAGIFAGEGTKATAVRCR